MESFRVEVVEYATGEVVKTFAPSSKRAAKRLESGVEINLNHAEYFTRICQEPGIR